jgi:hypothetical protein
MPHSLDWYVRELIAGLGQGDPSALARLRAVVAERRGWIGLEDESVTMWFAPDGALVVESGADIAGDALIRPLAVVDGAGHTRRSVVLALLAGELDVTDAVVDGEILVRGAAESVVAMFTAVEILIDSATRVQRLRALCDQYVREHADTPALGATSRRTPMNSPAPEPRTVTAPGPDG